MSSSELGADCRPENTCTIGEEAWAIPEHETVTFQSKQHDWCLCIFVINEGHKLLHQLDRMQNLSRSVDLVIADGGSSDGSTAHELLAARQVNTLLIKRGSGQLSAQMRMAFAFALRRGYQGIVVMDGNNKDDPVAIPSCIRALEQGCDHVQGSRFIRGGKAINTPLLRWLGINLVHAPLISLAAGYRYTDTTNGFRGYSRRLLLDPRVAPFREVFAGYELHYYLAIRAARLGYRITEVPATRAYPPGKVPTKIKGLRGNLRILKTLVQACLHRFDPVSFTQIP